VNATIATQTVTPATCGVDQVVTYTATAEFGGQTYTDTKENVTLEGTALEHNWSAWTVTVPATTEAEGLETRTCSNCNETETRVIPKIVVMDGAVMWAGYEKDIESVVVTEGTLPAATDNYIYVIAKKGDNNTPSKVQIRSTTGTMTYTRKHNSVKSIDDVTFNGEACELWVIDRGMKLADGAYIAVAKYQNVPFTAIPDTDGANFTVKTPVPASDSAVYSAEISVIDSKLGYVVFDGTTAQTITIKTGVDVTKVQLLNDDNNTTMTYNDKNAVVTEGTLEDGTACKVWTITRLFGKGDYNFSINVRTAKDGLKDSGKDLKFAVKEAPVAMLISANAVGNQDGTAVFTVVTNKDANRVKLTNTDNNTTVTISDPHKLATVKDNGDGTKTWTITLNFKAGTTVNMSVQARVGITYSDAQSVSFAMPKAAAAAA